MTDAAALDKAAGDFATKFPDSELKVVLYKLAMQKYQAANNADKMVGMAQKALTFDPMTLKRWWGWRRCWQNARATPIWTKTRNWQRPRKNAERALVTIDTDVPTAGYPPEKIAQFKGFLRSEAYAVLGHNCLERKELAGGRRANLRKSIDAFPEQVDSAPGIGCRSCSTR